MGETEEPELEAARLCANCHAPLVGRFCHQCGQQDRVLVRGAFSMFFEAFAEMFEYDSRVRRTFVPLFFKPGFLSTEWVKGHRARYVRPVRLYLFVSIVFFIALAAVTDFDADALREELVQEVRTEDGQVTRVPPTQRDGFEMNIPWLSDEQQAEMRSQIDKLAENPELFVEQAMTLAPQMMFVLLPLFAFILKVLYLFARRFYIEHLVLALHTHSFLFLSFTLLIGIGALRDFALAGVATVWIATPANVVSILLMLWLPVYLFIAQKRFYGQGWFFTTIKYLLTGTIYSTILLFGLVTLILLTIATA